MGGAGLLNVPFAREVPSLARSGGRRAGMPDRTRHRARQSNRRQTDHSGRANGSAGMARSIISSRKSVRSRSGSRASLGAVGVGRRYPISTALCSRAIAVVGLAGRLGGRHARAGRAGQVRQRGAGRRGPEPIALPLRDGRASYRPAARRRSAAAPAGSPMARRARPRLRQFSARPER